MKKTDSNISNRKSGVGIDRLINEIIKDEPRLMAVKKSTSHLRDECEGIVKKALDTFGAITK